MPSSPLSLSVTEAYRRGMVALRRRAETSVSQAWGGLDLNDIAGSYEPFLQAATRSVEVSQRQGVRLSAAYLAAFISAELGRRVRVAAPSLAPVGRSRDGRPLLAAYDSSRIAVLAALKDGRPPSEASGAGRHRAVRAAGLDSDTAVRESLAALMEADDRVEGYRRAVEGTCQACAGEASNSVLAPGTPLQIHPSCRCVAEPAIRGARTTVLRPTGQARFAALSASEQDKEYGPKVAELLRTGRIEPEDLVSRSRLATAEDFITAASAEEALANAARRHH